MEPLQSSGLSKKVSKGVPKGGFKVPLIASQGSSLPPEAAPSPSWERIEKVLSERREKDLQSFGIETHIRAPVNAYRYPPRPRIEREGGPAAFKPKYRDVWDPVQTPTDGTPRLIEHHHGLSTPGKHTKASRDSVEAWTLACKERKKKPPERYRPPAKPLPAYRNEAGEFGPNIHCEGLEPFEALDPDEFLAGPEGLPLSPAESRHLRRVGLDFREDKEAELRKLWLPHERERWQRSKRLRSLMKRGLVVFREDYEREQFEKDYLKYMGRPPRPRDCPWDPPVPFADGREAWTPTRVTREEQENDARQRKGDPMLLCACDPGEEYRKSLPWSYYEEIGDGAEVPTEDTPQCEAYLAVRQQKQAEEDPRLQPILETEVVRLYEAAAGKLPSIFAGLCKSRREKHPKDAIVPFHRLKAYGQMIAHITSCRMLQNEVAHELLADWGHSGQRGAAVEHMPPPKGARKNPNYELTSEKIKRAAEKLNAETQIDAEDMKLNLERRKRVVESTRVLGGGRYAV